MKIFPIIIFLFYTIPAGAQNFKNAMDTMKNIGVKENEYYKYISSANEKFNRKQFTLAEKDYLTALQLLLKDDSEKQRHPDNYAVGQLVLYKSLLEVNQGLRDQNDVNKYSAKIKKSEQEFAHASNLDISSYFEKLAKDEYKRKEFKEAFKNIHLGVINCKNESKRKELKLLEDEIEAMNKFLHKEYNASMILCDKVLSEQTGNTLVLDLRGRVSFAMGDKVNACKDWSKASELNYPVSKLRMNRNCK